uniref:Uncharacterized protein n=1 Tax=Oryza rufipogon TaxID=4529 RepID=A0A0E0PDE9_ORYRU
MEINQGKLTQVPNAEDSNNYQGRKGERKYLQDISGRQAPQYPKKHKLCNMTKLRFCVPFPDILKKYAKPFLWKTNKGFFYWLNKAIASYDKEHRKNSVNKPHPPLLMPRQSSSPAVVSFVIHIPRRSSLPTGVSFVIHVPLRSSSLTTASSTVHATSELVAGGRFLRRLDILAKYVLVVLHADDAARAAPLRSTSSSAAASALGSSSPAPAPALPARSSRSRAG